MAGSKHIYGPIPSRRLGRSLGISPIPKKACNFACVYCQLGPTDMMTTHRHEYYPLAEILREFSAYVSGKDTYDVVSIVGEGEPTLYSRLGELIRGLKEHTTRPVAVITNGALLSDASVRDELALADIVLPSLDAYDATAFRKINRPAKTITYDNYLNGLQSFARQYQGQLWLEIMLLKGINDHQQAIDAFREHLGAIRHDKLYLNTPVRPPAEKDIEPVPHQRLIEIGELLGGIPIDFLAQGSYDCDETDDYQAILNLIRRHPLNQHEIGVFLTARNIPAAEPLLHRLEQDPDVESISYRGYVTYRLK